MPALCTACHHSDRESIDALIVAGELSNRRIATQYGLSEQAIRRHRGNHLAPQIQRQLEAQEEHGFDMAALVRNLVNDAHRIKARAEREGDLRTALAGVRELTRLVELAVAIKLVDKDGQQPEPVQLIVTMPCECEHCNGKPHRSEQPAALPEPVNRATAHELSRRHDKPIRRRWP